MNSFLFEYFHAEETLTQQRDDEICLLRRLVGEAHMKIVAGILSIVRLHFSNVLGENNPDFSEITCLHFEYS